MLISPRRSAAVFGITCTDGCTPRRGTHCVGVPARDTVSLLLEATVPFWDRVEMELQGTAGANGALPTPMGSDDGRGRTCMACRGIESVSQAWLACLASFLAIGEPLGAADVGAYGGGGILSLLETVLALRPPPRLLPREEERPP